MGISTRNHFLARALGALMLVSTSAPTSAGLLDDVRAAIKQNNFAAAEQQIAAYQVKLGNTAELAAAVSWLGRGALANRDLDRADAYAERAHKVALDLIGGSSAARRLASDANLATALGAAIEVQGQVLDARGEKSRAVSYLQQQLAKYRTTVIAERLSKDLNLLSLVGKRAPALVASEWIGTAKPGSLASLKGKPVLLFFWAHWCPDCKNEIPIIASLMQRYRDRGLQLVGPTRYYGYMEAGEDATPAQEKAYIGQVRDRYYSPLRDMIIPLSNQNFITYGCSSTPTLAIVNKNGVVTWYHPGTATEAELVSEIEKVL